MGKFGSWRILSCAVLVWVVTVAGVIGGVVPPAEASAASPSAQAGSGVGSAALGLAAGGLVSAGGPAVGQVESLALARSGFQAFGAAALDQIEEDMVDRLEQKAVGQIQRPGFELWPASNQFQIVGLPTWFRVKAVSYTHLTLPTKA